MQMPLTGINLLTEQTSKTNVLPEVAVALTGEGVAADFSAGVGVARAGVVLACGDGLKDGFGAGFVTLAS
ncbi:MAG TPA: hypothetical protein VF988_14950 [Verrucomicrobiae bacterium]